MTMQVEYIKESAAPKPPKPLSKSAAQVLEILTTIKSDQVAKVTPGEGQTLRGLKASFSRVASKRGLKVQTWSIDNENVLYVKRLK